MTNEAVAVFARVWHASPAQDRKRELGRWAARMLRGEFSEFSPARHVGHICVRCLCRTASQSDAAVCLALDPDDIAIAVISVSTLREAEL